MKSANQAKIARAVRETLITLHGSLACTVEPLLGAITTWSKWLLFDIILLCLYCGVSVVHSHTGPSTAFSVTFKSTFFPSLAPSL